MICGGEVEFFAFFNKKIKFFIKKFGDSKNCCTFAMVFSK